MMSEVRPTRIVPASFALLLCLASMVAAQERRQPPPTSTPSPTFTQLVNRSKMPWVVSVVHTIDLRKQLARYKKEQNVRIGLPPSAPDFVYNVATGVVVDDVGHVVTRLVNLNPGEKGSRITITSADGSSVTANLVGVDYASGFAVLDAPSLKAPPVKVVRTSTVASGSAVRIVSTDVVQRANTQGAANFYLTATLKEAQGQVLAGNLYSKARGAMTLLSDSFRSRSDSSVVTDFEHQVVGIAQYAGFGRAYVFPFEYIRDTVVKRVVERRGDVPAGWLGILGDSVSKLPDSDVSPLGLTEKRGVIVREIISNGPAAVFGLQQNDVIVGIDGYDVASAADLGLLLSCYTAGSKVRLRGIRDRQPVDVTVVLGARDVQTQAAQSQLNWALERSAAAEAAEAKARLSELQGLYRSFLASAPSPDRNQALTELSIEMRFLYDGLRELGSQTVTSTAPPPRAIGPIRGGDFSGELEPSVETRAVVPLGFRARELTPQLSRELVVAGGMLVDIVVKDSAADKAGLKVGDVIVSVAGRQLFKASQLLAAATSPGPQVELRVVRNKQALSVVIPRP